MFAVVTKTDEEDGSRHRGRHAHAEIGEHEESMTKGLMMLKVRRHK
jgi:hypothetical protein